MRHRAGRHNWRAGMQRLPNADMPSCRQKRQTRRRATTNARVRHRAIRKDKHAGMQRIPTVCSTACFPFFPMATMREEKPRAKSLPSLPRCARLLATASSTWRAGDAVRKDKQLQQSRRGSTRTPTDMR